MPEDLRAADAAQALCDDAHVGEAETGNDERTPAMKPFQPFPIEALPMRIAQLVQGIAGATGTDPSWAALAALAVVAGCVGNRAAVILKRGWVEAAIVWAALVGKSGSTKSVVLRLVTRPLVDLFKQERDAFAEKLREYDADLERYHVAMSKWKAGQKNGPTTDPPLEPAKPKERRVLVSDVTVEKLAALLGDNSLGLLVVRDELAGLVNSFDRYAGGKGSDLQSWLSMNDAGPLLVDRKADGSTFVERASVSLLGTIQPFTLEHAFGTAEREAGLLARVVLAYPPDRPALWTDEELPDALAEDWCKLLRGLLSLAPGFDDAGRPRPRIIGLAGDAKRLFVSWHDRHAHETADLGDDHLRAHWSKLKGTCARIALLFACIEAVDGAGVSAISADSIKRAISVTEWLKHESARIYKGLRESTGDRDCRQLLEWITRRGGSVTVRDLTHNLWAYRGKAPAARAALDELAKQAPGRWVYPAAGVGGRPTARFELSQAGDITITETPPDDIMNGGFGDGDGGDRGDTESNSAPSRRREGQGGYE